jgi:hypothetical protein
MKTYGSHDLYWGPAAELGLFYLFFLLLMIKVLLNFRKIKHQVDQKLYNSVTSIFLFFALSFFICGSIQYRHLWLYLAILNSIFLSNNLNQNKQKSSIDEL